MLSGAIVELEIKIGVIPSQNSAHQIFDTERTVNEADERLTPLLDSIKGQVSVVQRQVHKETGLNILVGFLHQRNMS